MTAVEDLLAPNGRTATLWECLCSMHCLTLSGNNSVLNIFLPYKITDTGVRYFKTLCSTQRYCIFPLLPKSFVDRYILSCTFNGNSAGKCNGIYLACFWLVPSVLFHIYKGGKIDLTFLPFPEATLYIYCVQFFQLGIQSMRKQNSKIQVYGFSSSTLVLCIVLCMQSLHSNLNFSYNLQGPFSQQVLICLYKIIQNDDLLKNLNDVVIRENVYIYQKEGCHERNCFILQYVMFISSKLK